MIKSFTAALAATLSVALFAGLALAHSGATGVVKQRMELMKDIAGETKEIGRMVKGERPFDADTAARSAALMAEHAHGMVDLFPEGTTEAPSEARPAIWRDWDRFSVLAEDLEEKAAVLSELAASAAGVKDIRPAFAEIARTCSACHQDFRRAD